MKSIDFSTSGMKQKLVENFVKLNEKLIALLLKPQIELHFCALFKELFTKEINTEIRQYELKTSLVRKSAWAEDRNSDKQLLNGFITSPVKSINFRNGQAFLVSNKS